MNKAQEQYIHDLNLLASGSDLDNIEAISEAISNVKEWNLDGAMESLNKIDVLETTWHDRLLDIYCDLRAEGR